MSSVSLRRKVLAHMAAYAPTWTTRRLLLKALGYRVHKNARIELGNVIAVKSFVMESGIIRRNNRFIGPMTVHIGEGTEIGHRNAFLCPDWISATEGCPDASLSIGRNVLVTNDHLFDAAGGLAIGDGVWFAGSGTQVWTHGMGVGSVVIGEYTYVASAVRVASGVTVGQECVVAMGCVLTRGTYPSNALLTGVPGKVHVLPYEIRNWEHHRTWKRATRTD